MSPVMDEALAPHRDSVVANGTGTHQFSRKILLWRAILLSCRCKTRRPPSRGAGASASAVLLSCLYPVRHAAEADARFQLEGIPSNLRTGLHSPADAQLPVPVTACHRRSPSSVRRPASDAEQTATIKRPVSSELLLPANTSRLPDAPFRTRACSSSS